MDFGPDKECVEGKFWVETVSSGPIRPEKIPTKSIFGPDKERLNIHIRLLPGGRERRRRRK
jgi:hypothetical protein